VAQLLAAYRQSFAVKGVELIQPVAPDSPDSGELPTIARRLLRFDLGCADGNTTKNSSNRDHDRN
jgi:hypothetical protein